MSLVMNKRTSLYRRAHYNANLVNAQITEALAPTSLEIHNDSHKHAHHQAMKDSTSKETHFR